MENQTLKKEDTLSKNAEGFAYRWNDSSLKQRHVTIICDTSQAELTNRIQHALGPGIPFDWVGNSPWPDRAMPDLPLEAGSPEQLRLMNWAVGDYDQAAVLFLYGRPPKTASSLSDYLMKIRFMAPGACCFWADQGRGGPDLFSSLAHANIAPVDLSGKSAENSAGILAEHIRNAWQNALPLYRYDPSVREEAEWTNLSFDCAANCPRILLIGDSICNGYAPYIRERLHGRFAVDFFQTSEGTRHPNLTRAIEFLLSRRPYRLIHFNNGIHLHGAGVSEYGKNLEGIFSFLQEKSGGAELIFATTTPIHKNGDLSLPDEERTGLFRRYNQTAVSLCKKLDIPVDDLFLTACEKRLTKVDEFHFTAEGYRKLAEAATACIENRVLSPGRP